MYLKWPPQVGMQCLETHGTGKAVVSMQIRMPMGSHCVIARSVMGSVSFKFDDGSWRRHAFVYDWRVWPVSEMLELMAEAGFGSSAVCVDGHDSENGGAYTHEYRPLSLAEFDGAVAGEAFYSCYIVSHE